MTTTWVAAGLGKAKLCSARSFWSSAGCQAAEYTLTVAVIQHAVVQVALAIADVVAAARCLCTKHSRHTWKKMSSLSLCRVCN